MKATRCRKLREHLDKGCNSNDDDDDGSSRPPSQSYLSNSHQELQCLKHLDSVASSTTLSPERQQSGVLLSARNEYGTPKPLPTYLRPTLLPHPNLYDLKDLLRFVFRHVKHEGLEETQQDDEDELSATTITIASPNQTLEWRAGDSLDQSILLASLLLGAGYDAYVVVGTAPDWLRRGSTDTLRIGGEDGDWRGGCDAYSVNSNSSSSSSNRHGWIGMPFTEVPLIGDDHSKGQSDEGLHAWVMVRPGRRCGDNGDESTCTFDVASTIFADPAVARIWPAEDASPYASIQTIWNQSNQWVNLGPLDDDKDVKMPRYIDLEDTKLWRPVYTDASSILPLSWAEKIQMPVAYPPKEHRVELYDKAKLELSTSSNNVNFTKLTRYDDKERTEETESIEVFSGRSDHLLERNTRTAPSQTFVETFSEFHPLGLRRWSETLGVERTIEFHPRMRTDGLVYRKEEYVELKVEETFQDRHDGLTKRIIRVERMLEGDYIPKDALILTKSDGEETAVVKIEEHYGDLDEIKAKLEEDNKPAGQIITSRIFHLVENRISVTRACHDGVDIISNTEVIKNEQTDTTTRHALEKTCEENSTCKEIVSSGVTKAIIAERDSISSVLSISEDVLHLCLVRSNEEQSWLKQQGDASGSPTVIEKVPREQEEMPNVNMEEEPCDYLAPFLIGIDNVDHLSPEEAERIKEACLGALKDRLLERAQIMQSKLDEEMAKAKEESHGSAGDASAAARVMVWEKRLEQHEQLSLEKYALLQEKLNADARLQHAIT